MTRIVVYVERGGGVVETYTVEGEEAEMLAERLEMLAELGIARRGRLEAGALRL